MKKTLGGDRLGAGKKMSVDLHNYGRSTHNLSRVWRSTMSQCTLTPFLVEPILNGDTFDVDLETRVRTLPTNGPIFGNMKIQLDVFLCPIRLYISELHNNKLGVGMKMSNVKFPKMRLSADRSVPDGSDINQQQINPSSLLAYLGYRGIGKNTSDDVAITGFTREMQCLPILMYWDIYKNYYANKQEGKGFVITQDVGDDVVSYVDGIDLNGSHLDYSVVTQLTNVAPDANNIGINLMQQTGAAQTETILLGWRLRQAEGLVLNLNGSKSGTGVEVDLNNDAQPYIGIAGVNITWAFSDTGDAVNIRCQSTSGGGKNVWLISTSEKPAIAISNPAITQSVMSVESFDLDILDDMREELLHQAAGANVIINDLESGGGLPYTASYGKTPVEGSNKMNSIGVMAGLGLKTYLSDRFNNWLETEWIDGPNGIAAVSAVDTSSGSFTMDSLNLAQKVYNMLNRIAVSGGSYQDWQEAVWGEEVRWSAETPMYMGGLSGELGFDEVVSTADAQTESAGEQPLGSLAGRGVQVGERKGTVRIKANEPSIVIGIASFTPRIDYSQGNKWFTRWDNMDDLHKPALDGIGFQELITDEMAAFDTDVSVDGTPTFKSAGKQPAYIEYMTSQNECYGEFAQNDKAMFMTFSRRYTPDRNGNIQDLTTYMDPRNYNYAFAVQDITAQNLWVQIGINLIARRKMSAKMIPNL